MRSKRPCEGASFRHWNTESRLPRGGSLDSGPRLSGMLGALTAAICRRTGGLGPGSAPAVLWVVQNLPPQLGGAGFRSCRQKLTGQCPAITARVSTEGSSSAAPCPDTSGGAGMPAAAARSASCTPAAPAWCAGRRVGSEVVRCIFVPLIFSSSACLLSFNARRRKGTTASHCRRSSRTSPRAKHPKLTLFIQRTLS